MQTKSLYERLGGYDAIAAVTDELLARLLNDPQLGVFWKGHSENSLRGCLKSSGCCEPTQYQTRHRAASVRSVGYDGAFIPPVYRTDATYGLLFKQSLRRDRQLVVNFMCEAAGGPVFYTGRDMQTSHKGLGINASDWEVFMRHAAGTLEKFAVPATERDEVLAFLTSLQGDVVERA